MFNFVLFLLFRELSKLEISGGLFIQEMEWEEPYLDHLSTILLKLFSRQPMMKKSIFGLLEWWPINACWERFPSESIAS